MNPKNNNCPNCGSDKFYLLVDLQTSPSFYSIPYWLKNLSYKDERECVCFDCRQRAIPIDLSDNEMHEQARKFREEFAFTEAVGAYTDIINEVGTDTEAYWFRALSHHSIAGGHSQEDELQFFSTPLAIRLQDDNDFKKACDLSIDTTRKGEYQAAARTLDAVREEYFKIRNSRKEYQVYVCTDGYLGQEIKSLLAEDELEVFVQSEGKSPAEICFARNSAKVMIAIGALNGALQKQKSFFAKRLDGQSGFRLIHLTSDYEKASAGVTASDRWYDLGSDWKSKVLDCVREVFPKAKEIHTTTVIEKGDTYVVEDAHTAEAMEHAYDCFIKKDFKSAKESAERALQNGDRNPMCAFIKAFYHTYVENTSNRGAMQNFFSTYKNVIINEADVLKMKNVFLVAMMQVKEYEAQILNMLINSEVGTEGMCAFVDAFSSKLIPKQSGIEFLTPELLSAYIKLAQTNTIPKTCLALMAATKTNPASPLAQNDFHLITKAQTFYQKYFLPIGDVVRAMKDEGTRAKYVAVYNSELSKYESKMQ